jgi:hypothetical protein
MARVKCPWPSSMTSRTFSEAAMEEMNWRVSATWAGLVLYALASIAVMNAAVSDGLIAPTLLKKIVAASAETRDAWQMLMNFNFQMNQAFARVYAVGSSLAVVLWSVAVLRNRTLGRGAGISGVVLGLVTATGICSGFLTPDRHGFGMLIFGQAIWFLIVAGGMWRVRAGSGITTAGNP